jgi:hypothetical protein
MPFPVSHPLLVHPTDQGRAELGTEEQILDVLAMESNVAARLPHSYLVIGKDMPQPRWLDGGNVQRVVHGPAFGQGVPARPPQ